MSNGFKLVSSTTQPLTPELARKHRTMKPSPTERELTASRLKFLTAKLKAGLFIPCNWAIARLDGVEYRMNGQHSSSVLDDANGDFPKNLHVHLDVYECEDKIALGDLFRQFDCKQSQRGSLDICGAYQGLMPNLSDIPRKHAQTCAQGVSWHTRVIEGAPARTGDDVGTYLTEETYHPFVLWYGGDVLSIKTPELMVPAVAAAAYATFLETEAAAREFWRAVSIGQGVDDNSPPMVLAAVLVKAKEKKEIAHKLKPAEYYAKSVKAYNAYREGKTIRSLNIDLRKGMPEIHP